MKAIQVPIPLLNPNEPEALLAELLVEEGQQVAEGQPLCTLETTKATAELLAESAGYVVGLRVKQGQTARAGNTLCYLADSPDWQPPQQEIETAPSSPGIEGLRLTQPALELLQNSGLDLKDQLESLPPETLVTEAVVRSLLDWRLMPVEGAQPAGEFDPKAIIVYGGGGHGKSLIDLLRALGTYQLHGVIDDGISPETSVMGIPVLGGASTLVGLYNRGVRQAVNAVGGIGNITIRIQVFERLKQAGFTCPVVVHPKAFVEPSASLSQGVQVFPHAYVGSEAQVGYGAIVNTGAVVSHECILEDYANISPGALLAGGVQVGQGALIGMGATLNLQVRIGAWARVGNGATVKADLPQGGLVRAGGVWPE